MKTLNQAYPALYGGHSEPQKDENKVSKLQSAMQYHMHAAYIASRNCRHESVIMVGTHKDKLPQGELKQRKKYLKQITMGYAEEVGIADVFCPGMECINAKDASDCKRVLDHIVEHVHCKQDFEYDIPLRYIFFRCFLHGSKRMFISRRKLMGEAHKCGMTNDDEIEEFLDIFKNCGSLFYSIDGKVPILRDYIIINPLQFFRELDKLYHIDTMSFNNKPDLFEDMQNTRLGFVSEDLAMYLWPAEGEGKMTQAHFILSVLKELKIIIPVNGLLKTDSGKIIKGHHCYFMPSLRPDFDEPKLIGESNSLIITHNIAILPSQLLADVLFHVQNCFGTTITFDPKPYCNTICFKWCDSQKLYEANIVVRFLMEHTEISVKFLNHAPHMSTVTRVFSQLKTACIQFFHQISTRLKGLDYELAIVCPNSNRDANHTHNPPTGKVHFITFHPLATGEQTLLCQTCKELVPSEKLPWTRLLWTQVAYMGPSRDTMNHDSKLILYIYIISLQL